MQVAHVPLHRITVHLLRGSIQFESLRSQFGVASICLGPVHARVLFSGLSWVDSLDGLHSSTVPVAHSAPLFNLLRLVDQSLGALHGVGEGLSHVVSHVLVLLNRLILSRHTA